MTNDWKARLGMVYSTNPNFKYDTEEAPQIETLAPERQDLRVWLDRKQRGGKTVTLVKGFVGSMPTWGNWPACSKPAAAWAGQPRTAKSSSRATTATGWSKSSPKRVTNAKRPADDPACSHAPFRSDSVPAGIPLHRRKIRSRPILFVGCGCGCAALETPAHRGRTGRLSRHGIALAHRTLYYIQAVRPTITHGFSHPPLKIPFVLHTENFQSNGLVMWMPKRIEFLTTPSVDSYSMPWVKQLVAHEYRHAVQYNNLNRGLIRILSYLIGQQGSTVGLLFMPLWRSKAMR